MNTISAKELMDTLESAPETIELIDVRGTGEYEEAHLKEAKIIPLHVLPVRINEIDKSKKVVFICRSGGRSGQATTFAEGEGIKGYNLSGGMNAIEADYESKVIRGAKKGFFGLF
jgi:rhodanese-related sulfurtransferase